LGTREGGSRVPGREEGYRSGEDSITDPTGVDTRESVDRLAGLSDLRGFIRKVRLRSFVQGKA
jgi:hypothetical protein